MNDRIQELAEEHGLLHEYMTIGERNDALTKYREFAELIVQECVKIADADEERPNYLGCGYITKTIGVKIQEYFGVK